jgi:hypothetical protein
MYGGKGAMRSQVQNGFGVRADIFTEIGCAKERCSGGVDIAS